ncbi:MAG: trypsin-like peptidase domain-containing protein [Gemmatales bacterium]|nr:S1C family serine protease [Gemmatales bacterium]MDW7995161.1 trypsin-like peptidase domain-containing protein [Gemmatales bacterium]
MSQALRIVRGLLLLFVVSLALVGPRLADHFAVAQQPRPGSLQDDPLVAQLRLLQEKVQAVIERVKPAVVAIEIGPGQGSGVVVTKDGYVLTAGHVSGKPGRQVTVIFPDGKRIKGTTLGMNPSMDSGMVKLEGAGPWPYVEMGDTSQLQVGDWVVALGHPSGFRPGRPPVVRLGRVLRMSEQFLVTDCTLVGGDSGGPLFDLRGRVVGIHSRIGASLADNVHVPVNTYHETWETLARGEVVIMPYLGVRGDEQAEQAKILEVMPDSPAAKAGIQPNDIILSFDGRKITNYRSLVEQLRRKRPGQVVSVEVLRNGEKLELKVKLAARPM